ncbi:hypothetical protein SAMN06265173_1319 [Thalassovita litoralis]|uniref:Uncharacterized protein n=1 Tax=Thalassovita litoralis TaxID=1010611 RepID=A0A521FIR0_9RHOB|nr:hypothetical protein [Thalassovita litoralis]SMO95989.1 hypothetical protein SAMN06265173_1319 [Thalassovita litoralis]
MTEAKQDMHATHAISAVTVNHEAHGPTVLLCLLKETGEISGDIILPAPPHYARQVAQYIIDAADRAEAGQFDIPTRVVAGGGV